MFKSSKLKKFTMSMKRNPDNGHPRNFSRFNSFFSVRESEEDCVPVAKVDIALVGVEHAGKTTFFKQVTSLYAKEDFEALKRSDGRSQAMGRMLKITLKVLKPIADDLEREDAKTAAKVLMNSFALYTLTPSTARALKDVWADPVFYKAYEKSPFYQVTDMKKDIDDCELLLDEKYVISKDLHLKLHNATHGYNSSKFSFKSTQPIIAKPGANKKEAKSMPPLISEVKSRVSRNKPRKSAVSDNPPKSKRRNDSIAGAVMASTRTFRSKLTRAGTKAKTRVLSLYKDKVPMEKRLNEVRIWDIGGLFERRTDWEYFLRRSNLTMFFVSLADYSTETDDGSGENLLQDSLNMFQVLCESEFLKDQVIQIVLTKKDIFAEKMNNLKIPLNVSGLFADAPGGEEEFDIDSNIDYIREMFLKVTETENSFLTRHNISFREMNLLEEKRVKEYFNDCIATIRAETPCEDDELRKAESKNTDEYLEELNKKHRPRGFSVKLRSVSIAIRKSLRRSPSQSGSKNGGGGGVRDYYRQNTDKHKRKSKRKSSKNNRKSTNPVTEGK